MKDNYFEKNFWKKSHSNKYVSCTHCTHLVTRASPALNEWSSILTVNRAKGMTQPFASRRDARTYTLKLIPLTHRHRRKENQNASKYIKNQNKIMI